MISPAAALGSGGQQGMNGEGVRVIITCTLLHTALCTLHTAEGVRVVITCTLCPHTAQKDPHMSY